MSDEITFKTRHNGWTFITDVVYQGRKVGYIIAMTCTGVWDEEKWTASTDFRIFTIKCEERGRSKTLVGAKLLVYALQKQKEEYRRFKR